MSKYLISNSILTDIADSIREKTGSQETLSPASFSNEIDGISGGDMSEYLTTTINNNTTNDSRYGDRAFKKVPNGLIVTSNVTNLAYAFRFSNITEFSFNSSSNTSNVTDLGSTFQECRQLTSVDFSNFDDTRLSIMYYTFNNCVNLEEIDLSNLTSDTVTNIGFTFAGCSKLKRINLQNIKTTHLTYFANAFYNCTLLEFLDIRNFTFGSVTNSSNTFTGIPSNCEIIVKSQTEKDWILSQRSDLTNVKTVAEYEAEQNE